LTLKKLSDLNIRYITIIQLVVALIISLLFQFVIPLSWQPLDAYESGYNIKHGDPETNLVFFTISLWYFSLSIVWFLRRDNKYINHFLLYSIFPLSLMVVLEFSVLGLYYDYIHILPLIIAIYITWKKRDSLVSHYIIYYTIILTAWLFTVYFLELAYYGAPLSTFIFNWSVNTLLNIGYTFFIIYLKKKSRKS
jgi:hypothetical protein